MLDVRRTCPEGNSGSQHTPSAQTRRCSAAVAVLPVAVLHRFRGSLIELCIRVAYDVASDAFSQLPACVVCHSQIRSRSLQACQSVLLPHCLQLPRHPLAAI